MKSFPPELIYILLFAAIVLFQYVMKQLGQKVQQEQEQKEQQELQELQELQEHQEQREPMQEEFLKPSSWEVSKTAAAPTISNPPVRQFERTEAPRAILRSANPRFSRQALMGNKKGVQDAIVIAAIIGPCRAFEAHDIR